MKDTDKKPKEFTGADMMKIIAGSLFVILCTLALIIGWGVLLDLFAHHVVARIPGFFNSLSICR